MALHNLVSEASSVGDGGKTSIFFTFKGFKEEKPLSKEEKKAKVKPTWGPVELSKRSFSDVFNSLESLDSDISTMSYSSLAKFAEKKLAPGLTLWISEQQAQIDAEDRVAAEDFVPEKEGDEFPAHPEFFRSLLLSVKERIAQLDSSKSTADPYGDCKRRFTKSAVYSILKDCQTPADLVVENIQNEIDALVDLQLKAKLVSQEEYLSFLEEKKAKNGLDEGGYVLLRDVSK